MSIRYLFPVILASIVLVGCSSTSDVLDTVGNESSATTNKLRDYAGVGHKSKDNSKEAQTRYCYNTLEDIICYGQPIPGQEERLMGYQTASGKTGYTLPPANLPSGAQMAPIKSMNVPPPPAVKEDKSQLKEIIFDPAELEPKELVPDKQQ